VTSALTIAGVDPTGGAGVFADLRAFAAAGVPASAVVTAVTAQNARGVSAVHAIPASVVRAQLDAAIADRRPAAVKTGMLATAEIVRTVAEAVRGHGFSELVVDPVLAASAGGSLLDADAWEPLLVDLIPLARVVTPNVAEAAALTGLAVRSVGDARTAAHELLRRGARAVIVKGGHLPGAAVDLLVTADGDVPFSGERIGGHVRGTGCTFASILAARIALGDDLVAAAGAAKAYVAALLRAADADGLRRALRLYLIADSGLMTPLDLPAAVEAAVRGGVRIVQLRAKGLDTLAQIALARELAALCHRAGAMFVVNDRLDVTIASGADGIHVGHQGVEDIAPADARRALGADAIVGVSVGSPEEARDAEAAGASYVSAGPMFATATKSDAGPAAGVALLRAVRAATNLPLVVIGGITADRSAELIGAGADGVCVASAILRAPDPEAAALAFPLREDGALG